MLVLMQFCSQYAARHAMRIQLSVSSSMGALYKSRLVVLQQIESSCCLVPLSDVWLLTAAALVLAAGAVALASTQHCLDLCHHVQLLWCYSKAVQHE